MKSVKASPHHIGAGLFVLALLLSGRNAAAKVDVPYGADGSPPDSDAQAKADAYNDALDGPKEGQSTTSWLEDLKAAHDAMYSQPLDLDADWGSGGGTHVGAGSNAATEIDLCQSPFSDWVSWVTPKDPTELVSKALGDSALKKDIEFALENIIYYQLATGTAIEGEATKPHLEVERPRVSGLSCTNGTSAFAGTVPVKRVWLGVNLDNASVSLHANATYVDDPRTPSWCIYVTSFDIQGLIGGSPLLADALGQHPFCWPAHVPAPWGTAYP